MLILPNLNKIHTQFVGPDVEIVKRKPPLKNDTSTLP